MQPSARLKFRSTARFDPQSERAGQFDKPSSLVGRRALTIGPISAVLDRLQKADEPGFGLVQSGLDRPSRVSGRPDSAPFDRFARRAFDQVQERLAFLGTGTGGRFLANSSAWNRFSWNVTSKSRYLSRPTLPSACVKSGRKIRAIASVTKSHARAIKTGRDPSKTDHPFNKTNPIGSVGWVLRNQIQGGDGSDSGSGSRSERKKGTGTWPGNRRTGAEGSTKGREPVPFFLTCGQFERDPVSWHRPR
jgi:hypothetical protein